MFSETSRRLRFGAAATLLLVSALLLGLSPASAVADEDQDGAAGHVYVLNNNLFGANSITSFARAANGTLTLSEVTRAATRSPYSTYMMAGCLWREYSHLADQVRSA